MRDNNTHHLFIPKKIRVGFQNRPDTYTKRLAYVIYYDAQGVLRKEKSWDGWRDQQIDPEEYDNTPQDGFVLNKDIRRYGWDHFSSNRSMIRIYDPRGIEFEITPENLIGLLMETTCSKRGIEGQCVYAWHGTELVLLPCGSEEYQKALQFTERQDQKVAAKDMKPGCSYTTKKGEEVIYIGRYNWYTWKDYRSGRTCKKAHIFAHPQKPPNTYPGYGQRFFPKSDVSSIATLNNPDPVQNYADLVDEFNGDIHSSAIVKWETTPVKLELKTRVGIYGREPKRTEYAEPVGENFVFWSLTASRAYCGTVYANNGYLLQRVGTFYPDTLRREQEPYEPYIRHHNQKVNVLSEQDVLARMTKFVDVSMVLESGKKVPFRHFNSTGENDHFYHDDEETEDGEENNG